MAPRDRLSSTRAAFIQAFELAIQQIVPAAIEALYGRAAACNAGEAQQEIFRARSSLQERKSAILAALLHQIEQLTSRSIATAYDSYRPPSALNATTLNDLTLLDQHDFEHSLRFNSIIQRIRHQAGQELIDLNIRIAVLFTQDDITERENPFRPYLLVQAIAAAVDQQALPAAETAILTGQLGEVLSNRVQEIYRAANVDLAMQGIEAHLSLKINKSLDSGGGRASPPAAAEQHWGDEPRYPTAHSAGEQSGGGYPGGMAFPQLMTRPPIRIDQLLDRLRAPGSAEQGAQTGAMPAGAGALPASAAQTLAPASTSASVSASAQPAGSDLPWLSQGVDLGQMMRAVLGVPAELNTQQRGGYRPVNAVHTLDLSEPQMAPVAIGAHDYSARTNALLAQLSQLGQMGQIGGAAMPAGMQPGMSSADAAAAPVLPKLEQALGQMHKHLVPPAEQMLGSDGSLRNLLREQREVLFDLAATEQAQMSVDVLSLLFESFAADPLLDNEFKLQLGRLQYLLLQLALGDNHFLLSGNHAARALFNRIASVRLSAPVTAVMQAQFEEETKRIFKTLARHDCSVPGLFERIHNRFDTFISRELRNFDKGVRRCVKSIEEAQIRCLQDLQLGELMQQGIGDLELASHFHTFLLKDWTRVIALAERRDPALAARYRALVPELIWSTLPKQSDDERRQLNDMLLELNHHLRQGVYTLNWNQFKQHALFNWLLEAHNRALKPAVSMVAPIPQPELPASISLAAMRGRFYELSDQPVSGLSGSLTREQYPLVRSHLSEVLAELGMSARFIDPPGVGETAADEAIPAWSNFKGSEQADATEIAARYYSGRSFEMQYGNVNRLGCICWVNPNAQNLVLLLKDVREPVVADLLEFQQRLNSGKIQLLETAPLFDRAILSLLKSADEMDHAIAL